MSLEVRRLGTVRYGVVWDLQRQLQAAVIAGTGPEVLLVCEHFPVITVGKTAREDGLRVEARVLADRGVEYFEVERGGKATFHAPGQIVAYPIIDLTRRVRDAHRYLRILEEAIIATLAEFAIMGFRVPDRTGVWVRSPDGRERKIASIGVRLSRWVTLHGLALNVSSLREGFDLIYPCGFHDVEMSSVEEECGKAVAVADVERSLIRRLCDMLAVGSEAWGEARAADAPE